MEFLEWFLFIALLIVFYTYLGYGILLYMLVRVKRLFTKKGADNNAFPELPVITLFITAWNEEDVVADKMKNTRELDYPADKLHVLWVTDGTSDGTNERLANYPDVEVQFRPERLGKTAAMNRGIQFVKTPIVIFTDANTLLNKEALREIVKSFQDPLVGCVAGEKRIQQSEKDKAVSSGEGIYWKYESKLKTWDSELNSVVGAAGELFAIRTALYEEMPVDTLLDDFTLSLRIACKGYKTAYNANAYAIETASAEMAEEEKRKVRIAAGGLQSVWRLRSLLNVFKYKLLSFQYISHRVLRWTITPLLLALIVPVNVGLVFLSEHSIFRLLLLSQLFFYSAGFIGKLLEQRKLRFKALFVPYYFTFMNLCVFQGAFYLRKKRANGAWERARRG